MNTVTLIKKENHFRQIDKEEPSWLYTRRRDSWQKYLETPLPPRVTNLWRYTDPKHFVAGNEEALMKTVPLLSSKNPPAVHPAGSHYAGYGYNHDDLSVVTRLDRHLRDGGVIFSDLYSAARESEAIAARYLGELVGADFGKWEAFNLALWNNGFFLYVPDNTIIEKPVRINRHAGAFDSLARLLVVVGRNARLTLIDDLSGECHKGLSGINTAVEIFAGDAAQVNYINIQRLAAGCVSFTTQRARIESYAKMQTVLGGMGGGLSKVNAGTILDGRGASSRMHGIVFGDDHQHFDYHTMHHHRQSDSYSNIDFKVILKDKATSAYTGLIRIEKETANCEAYQENRNLLLNKGTRAESIPELEILADQVRCTHGATMGPIDNDLLFYMASRGITRNDAINIIVSGFVAPTIERIPADLQGLTTSLIQGKLGGI